MQAEKPLNRSTDPASRRYRRCGVPRLYAARVQLSGVDYIDRFAVHKCLDIVDSRIHDALAAAFGRP